MAGSVALLTSHPDLLGCQLLRLEPHVRMDEVAHGTTTLGAGTIADGPPLLRRWNARAAPPGLSASEFARPARALLLRAQALGPAAAPDEEEPLRFGRWLFAAEGTMEAFPRVQAWVEGELPPHLRRAVGVRTLGAAAFSLFLAGLRSAEHDVPVARDGARLLAGVARVLSRRSALEGAAHAARLVLLATDGTVLLAARAGDAAAHVRVLEGAAACARCGHDGRAPTDASVRAHERARAVAVTTLAPAPGTHWLALVDGGAVGVGPSLEPELLPP